MRKLTTQKFNIARCDVFVCVLVLVLCGAAVALGGKLHHLSHKSPYKMTHNMRSFNVDASHQHQMVILAYITHSTRTTRYHTITVDMIVHIKRQIDDAKRVLTMKTSKRTMCGV